MKKLEDYVCQVEIKDGKIMPAKIGVANSDINVLKITISKELIKEILDSLREKTL